MASLLSPPALCTVLPSSSSFFNKTASYPSAVSFRSTRVALGRSSWNVARKEEFVCRAIAGDLQLGDAKGKEEEDVIIGEELEEDLSFSEEGVKYNWQEEWYPLYLTEQVPEDAPLAVSVFDKKLVLYKDGRGVLRCHEDRCPHRLAKLSEGQIVDGRLECLYHGWQFEVEGKCVKIPQLPSGAKIPRAACLKNYELRDSQGVVWVWISDQVKPDDSKLPWFEHYARPGFQHLSTIHELPYDHSILLENLMDPAHVPISHDRTDWTAKRENAQALSFKVTERTDRGFAGEWNLSSITNNPNIMRFQAPCVLQSNQKVVEKNGKERFLSALFLCRPAGQGKSVVIVRFGTTAFSPLAKIFPRWYLHHNACKILEQDMGFLSSQNEVLTKEKIPTNKLYINLKSCDTWVAEYRKWMDRVGHGMPYYFGHNTVSPPKDPAVFEHAPAGLVASLSASMPAKGGLGTLHSPNLLNRYFRHVVHCKGCQRVVKAFKYWKNALSVLALVSTAAAILASGRQWKTLLVLSTAVFLSASYGCSAAVSMITTNFVRTHRRI